MTATKIASAKPGKKTRMTKALPTTSERIESLKIALGITKDPWENLRYQVRKLQA